MFKFPVLHNSFLRHLKTRYITWNTDALTDHKYVLPHETHLRFFTYSIEDWISIILGISKVGNMFLPYLELGRTQSSGLLVVYQMVEQCQIYIAASFFPKTCINLI